MRSWPDFGIEIPSDGASGEVYTTCPKCSHERKKKNAKCLSANLDSGLWVCHHCAWSGSLKTGRDERHPRAWQKPQYRRPTPQPLAELPAHVVRWFADRGITHAVLTRNKIGWARVYMPQIEDHADAIAFPYLRSGELINRKYRTLDKHFRVDTGAERILYGLDDVGETLVWVEGEIDRLSVEVAGLTSCVSVPDGAPPAGTKDYSSKFTFLDSATEVLSAVKRHVIAVDSDKPGSVLEDELARRLGREKCWRVEWPEGSKDANDVLVKHGATDLRWFIDHAQPFPIEGVFTALGEQGKVFALYRNGFERGGSTGWRSLDAHYTVRPGEFTVITGIPSSGKSNWLDALAVNLARLHGWAFGIFSPENQPLEDHMARIVEKYVGLPFSDGPTPRMSEADVRRGLEWVGEHFWWMLPNDESSWDIGWILACAKELVYRHGIRGLIIDPWNELEPQRKPSETETEYISRVLRTVRQFARRHGVHLFMVVHPTKLYRNDNGKYPIPTLYDCMGSAHWRNKADNGLCVWRDLSDRNGREVDIHVQKIRFRQIGRLGKVTLLYDPPTGRYVEETSNGAEDRRYGA